ncbi:MAG: ABC transporter permease [Candidatus Bathyarchaeia archaeon]|jgi:peptide/nickel transport system permease protein
MGLRKFIAQRTIYMAIVLWLALTANFIIFNLMPGDPVLQYVAKLSGRIDEQRLNEIRAYFGLDKPLHERYLQYIFNLLQWNFGKSYYSGSVSFLMTERLARTLELMGLATFITIVLGILLGAVAAYKRGSLTDSALVVGSLFTYSVPIFWLGWIIKLVLAHQLKIFPSAGMHPDAWIGGRWPKDIITYLSGRLYHLALPTITLTLFSVGGWILLTRACVLENITEDYVITARAKGVKERTILYKHVMKNAALPIITSVVLAVAGMIGGAIITETLFSYQGMGLLTWTAIQNRDIPILSAIFYVTTLLTIIANFTADLLYGVLDPRIRYG